MSAPVTTRATVARPLLTRGRKVALVVAVVLILVAAVLSLTGMGSDVGVLSGTLPRSVGGAFAGVVYAATWFGAVVLAPALLLFVLFDLVLERLARIPGWIRSRRP